MKKVFITFACLALLQPLQAQHREKEISLAYGPYQQKTLDEQASPLLYKTHNANTAAFSYTRRAEKSRFSFKLNPAWGSYAPQRFKSRVYGDENYTYSITPTLYALSLKTSYLRKISLGASNLKQQFFIGAEVSNNLLISDQIANTYWANNVLAINLAAQAEWKLTPQQKLTSSLSVPAVAMVSRANYANFPKSTNGTNFVEFFRQGSNLASLNKLQGVNLEARYSYSLARRLSLGAIYQFNWFHYPDPRPVHSYSQALLLQTSYHFQFR